MTRSAVCQPAPAPALARGAGLWVAGSLMAMTIALAPAVAQAFSTAVFLHRADGAPAGDCAGAGPPPAGIYRVQILHRGGVAGSESVRSILGFGVQWSGEKITQFVELNVLDDKSMDSPSAPGLPQPVVLTASTLVDNPILQMLATRAGWSKGQEKEAAQAKDRMIGAIIGLFCRTEKRPDVAGGDVLLIHRLLAPRAALSAQDVADLWAFYAPTRSPTEPQTLDGLRALVKDRIGFTEMADYGGRIASRHTELHRAFAFALESVHMDKPSPTQGTVQPDSKAWKTYFEDLADSRAKEQVKMALDAQWAGIIRPAIVLGMLLALLALGLAVVALAFLMRSHRSAVRDHPTRSGTEQGSPENAIRESVAKFGRVAEDHAAWLAVLDRSVDELKAKFEALSATVPPSQTAAAPPEWNALLVDLEQGQLRVEARLNAVESGVASIRKAMEQTRHLTSSAMAQAPANLPVGSPRRAEPDRLERPQASRGETTLSLQQERYLRLLTHYGADPTTLSRAHAAGQIPGTSTRGERLGEMAVDLLPERLAPGDYQRIDGALADATSGKFRLIAPKPGDLYASTEHEIATYSAARKGNISRIDALVRPGLRRGQDVLRKARVIVPN